MVRYEKTQPLSESNGTGSSNCLIKCMINFVWIFFVFRLVEQAFDMENTYFSISESGQLLQLLAKEPLAVDFILENVQADSTAFFNRFISTFDRK